MEWRRSRNGVDTIGWFYLFDYDCPSVSDLPEEPLRIHSIPFCEDHSFSSEWVVGICARLWM